MELHVYDIEGKITVKVLKPFSFKGAQVGNVRRPAQQTEERLKLFNKVLLKKKTIVDIVEEKTRNSLS